MEFLCYGLPRDFMTYLITMVIALTPTLILYKVLGCGKKPEVIEITPTFDSFSLAGVVVFVVFLVSFYSGISASHLLMADGCGFSPNYVGLEQEERIQELQYEIEEREAELRYQQQILRSLKD